MSQMPDKIWLHKDTKYNTGDVVCGYQYEFAEGIEDEGGIENFVEYVRAKNIWKPADGDNLPEIDREVVVFTQNFPDDAGIMKVAIAHRPNPNGWDGRNILTGEVNHYTPKTYDNGGWSIPDVKYWLDLDLPKMEEGEV